MARARKREINIFNIAFLDVITGAMGAFVLMVLLLAPYYSGDVKTDPHLDKAQREIQKAENDIDQALRAGIDPRKVEELKRLLAAAIKALQTSQSEIKALKYQLNQLTAQNKRLKALDDQQQAQIAQLNTQIQNLWDRLRNALAEVRQMKQQVADLRTRLNNALAEVQQLRQEVADLRTKLSNAQAEVQHLKQEVGSLRGQLNQANAQVQAQSNKINQQAQEINYLKQHQGRSRPQRPLSPITVTAEWSCDGISLDLYVLSKYHAGHKPDKPFDPAARPTDLISNVVGYSPAANFVHILLPYSKYATSMRIFFVLRHPLGLPAALAGLQACPLKMLVTTTADAQTISGSLHLSNANPIIFPINIKIDDKLSISMTYPPFPGIQVLPSVEQDNIKKWEAAKKDELFPLAAARQGRKSPELLSSLKERAKWDTMMMSKNPPPPAAVQIRQDLQSIEAILGPQGTPSKQK